MARITPHDIHGAAVIGGTAVGLIMAGLGALLFNAAYNAGPTDTLIDLIEGATFFSAGAAFVLVSGILLPGLRATRLESASQTRTP
jgi:hypothetical protein